MKVVHNAAFPQGSDDNGPRRDQHSRQSISRSRNADDADVLSGFRRARSHQYDIEPSGCECSTLLLENTDVQRGMDRRHMHDSTAGSVACAGHRASSCQYPSPWLGLIIATVLRMASVTALTV